MTFAVAAPANAQISNSDIDAVAEALGNEPSFSDGGYEAKIGYYFAELLQGSDWPVKEEDVRKSHTGSIPADRDTDGDGIPDLDDTDMDGDGIPNYRDDDIDGDGYLNADDKHDYDSKKHVWDPSSRDPDGGNGPYNPFGPLNYGSGVYSYQEEFFFETPVGVVVEFGYKGAYQTMVVDSVKEAMLVIETSLEY